MIGIPTHDTHDIAPPVDPATLGYVPADYENSYGAPITPVLPLSEQNQIWDWSYIGISFIIFTIAVAVLRRQMKTFSGQYNIPKEINKRMRRALGRDENPRSVNNDSDGMLPGLPNPDPSGYREIDEEEKSGGAPPEKKSLFNKTSGRIGSALTGIKDGASSLVKKVNNSSSTDGGDAAMYKQLGNDGIEMGNLKSKDNGKRMWTAEGAVLIDKTGKVTNDSSLKIIADQIEDQS